MLTKAEIKFVRSLEDKSERYANRQFVAEGNKSVLDLLASNLVPVVVYATSSWLNQHTADARKARVMEVNERELEQMSGLKNSREVIALFEIPEYPFRPNTLKGLVPVLDGLQDPGNLGTLIRIADWYGIPEILCSMDTVDAYNPKVVQSSMGSIGRVKIHRVDLQETISLAGLPAIGTGLQGVDSRNYSFPENFFLLLGNEGSGIRPELKKHFTQTVRIERYGLAESLNAAVAGAILIDRYFGQVK